MKKIVAFLFCVIMACFTWLPITAAPLQSRVTEHYPVQMTQPEQDLVDNVKSVLTAHQSWQIWQATTLGGTQFGYTTPVVDPNIIPAQLSATCALTNTMPTIVQPLAGELIVLYVKASTTGALTAPSGFSTLASGQNSFFWRKYYKIASGSGETSIAFTDSLANGNCSAWEYVVGNENQSAPFDTTNVNQSVLNSTTGPFATTGLTPSTSHDLAVSDIDAGTSSLTVDSTKLLPSGITLVGTNAKFTDSLLYQQLSTTATYTSSIQTTAINNFAHQAEFLDLIAPCTSTCSGTTPPPSAPSGGSVVWEAGTAGVDSWVTANTNQCGNPSTSGSSFTFFLQQATITSGVTNTPPPTNGGTNCQRNQANPDSGNCVSGSTSQCFLASSTTYLVHFVFRDSDINNNQPGMADCNINVGGTCGVTSCSYPPGATGCPGEGRALLWQLHPTSCSCTPLFHLDMVNGPDSLSDPQYWGLFTGAQTNGTATYTTPYTKGATVTWDIEFTINSNGSCLNTGGSPCPTDGAVTLWENGVQKYTNSAVTLLCCSTITSPTTQWTNFGIYRAQWGNTPNASDVLSVNATYDNFTIRNCPNGYLVSPC